MQEKIKTAQPGETFWDVDEKASIKGLHVKVTAGGVKNFYFYYRTKSGIQRRPKIGTAGEITLAEARRRAKTLGDRVAMGEDPKGLWEEQKAELTIGELFARVWEAYWSKARFAASGWGTEAKRIYEKNIASTFGHMKLSHVTPLVVRDWHDKMKDTPYKANRSLEVLSKMFRFAEERELRPQNSNPCSLVPGHSEKKRKRFATPDEIRRIHLELQKYAEKYPHAVAFLYILMFSGSRPRAIERAEWSQLKTFKGENGEEYGILTFHGKTTETTGEEESVVLPPQAMKVINRLPRIEGMTITATKMPRWLWEKIRKDVGCEDLWARDFRRTFATIGLSNGVNLDTVGELLNHKTNETTKIYAKVVDEVKTKAALKIADAIEEITKPQLKLVSG